MNDDDVVAPGSDDDAPVGDDHEAAPGSIDEALGMLHNFGGLNVGAIPGLAGATSGLGAARAASGAYKIWQESTLGEFSPSMLAASALGGANLAALGGSISRLSGTDFMASFDVISALARYASEAPTLTSPSDYADLDAPAGAYSSHMRSPQSYFRSTEEVITDFDDLHRAITTLISKTPNLPLVWRGVRNADWGMHSQLYRHLIGTNSVVPPQNNPKEAQPYPDEDQMVAAEREILGIARGDWRFDNMSALETFARIQHAGGPTRLIDVTKNPYIAAWFAVEFDEEQEGDDARLFALATRPVVQDGKPPAPDSALQLDDLGAARDPFWHLLTDNESRQSLDWGTGARRRIWVPPAYDPRISAQNAAFVLDGVPMTSAKLAPYFTVEKNVYWRRADLLASASIYARMFKPTRKPPYNARNFAPTFSFRIEAGAKKEIREVMESRFGYRLSYIYPDMAALATHLKKRPLNRVSKSA